MDPSIFRSIITKIAEERAARGMNQEHDRGAAHQPQVWIIYNSERPPDEIDTIPEQLWERVTPPYRLVNFLAEFLEGELRDLEPYPEYYGACFVSEAWMRTVPPDDEEAKERLKEQSRRRELGDDPESVTVIVGCAYSPRDDQFVYVSVREDGSYHDYVEDEEGKDSLVGAVPDAVRRLGNALMGSERVSP